MRSIIKIFTTGVAFLFSLSLWGCDSKESPDISNEAVPAESDSARDRIMEVEVEQNVPAIPYGITNAELYQTATRLFKQGNLESAKVYFEAATKKGMSGAHTYLGLIAEREGEIDGNKQAIKHYLLALADTPHLTPMVKLARAYQAGNGVNKDLAASLQYYYRVKLLAKGRNLVAYNEADDIISRANSNDIAIAQAREINMLKSLGSPSYKLLKNNIAQALHDGVYIAPVN